MTQNKQNNTSQQSTNTPLFEILKQRSLQQDSTENSHLSASLEKFRHQKELEKKRIEQFHQSRQREWSQIYSAKEKEVEKRLITIRQQLKQLAQQVKRLDQSTKTAIESETTGVGEYHLSFFDQLQQHLQLLSKKVVEANTWLQLYHQRSQKKSYYWGQFSQKGSSFSLNQERQLATSVN